MWYKLVLPIYWIFYNDNMKIYMKEKVRQWRINYISNLSS